ncbi:LysE family translocator [uncultured Polaribacter sp.]|uniref:LysE family translocator n=1 Tax=uncultured Polaribacter sp. TaxID=174711 RepID=UPI00260CA785|nr:LysE family translocator [uncultured Polaribacter sp.]
MLQTLISFAFATFFLAISPGPDNIFVLTQSIANGKKAGLLTVFGLMSGCLIHTTLIAFGVSVIIKENENIFIFIKILGASYLLYLAFKVYKSDAKLVLSNQIVKKTTSIQLFKKGFIMNVLNPKVTLFFLALFPQFLFSSSIPTSVQFYVLGFIFILVSFIVFTSISLLAARVSTFIREKPSIGLYLKWTQIIVFTAIAFMILL